MAKRWGDWADDDGDDSLPPRQDFGPDEHGVRTTIEYRHNDKGQVVKTTTKVKVRVVERKTSRAIQERKKWPRFGQAASETSRDLYTVQSPENIPFERTNILAKKEEQKPEDIAKMNQGGFTVVTNLKDMLAKKRLERQLLEAKGLLQLEKPPTEDGPPSGRGGPAGGPPGAGKSGYVPPHLRGGASSGDAMGKRPREETSVRVSNLSEDTTEADLRDLFGRFGAIHRVHIATKENGDSRGFGFVNFVRKEDAGRAVEKLNGYGYANLILTVEFAQERGDRPPGGGDRGGDRRPERR